MFKVISGYIEMNGDRIAKILDGADERTIRDILESCVNVDDERIYNEDELRDGLEKAKEETLEDAKTAIKEAFSSIIDDALDGII